MGSITLYYYCLPDTHSVKSLITITSEVADDIINSAATTLSADELIQPLVDVQENRGVMLRGMADNSSQRLAEIVSDGN